MGPALPKAFAEEVNKNDLQEPDGLGYLIQSSLSHNSLPGFNIQGLDEDSDSAAAGKGSLGPCHLEPELSSQVI
jgi:hypothetical protein